jgi:hypothetical protein
LQFFSCQALAHTILVIIGSTALGDNLQTTTMFYVWTQIGIHFSLLWTDWDMRVFSRCCPNWLENATEDETGFDSDLTPDSFDLDEDELLARAKSRSIQLEADAHADAYHAMHDDNS